MDNQETPDNIRTKVKVAVAGGTLTAVVLAVVEALSDPSKYDTGDAALGAAVATAVAFVAAYVKRDSLSR